MLLKVSEELVGCQMVVWVESWQDKGTETVPVITEISTLVCSLAKGEVDKETLWFAEALEEEGINKKVKEKSNRDLNKKLWKSSCSLAHLMHCRKHTGQGMLQAVLWRCPYALQELFFPI